MMTLDEYQPETKDIVFKSRKDEVKFTVRGLNLDDFTHLVRLHLDDLQALRELYDRMKVDVYTRANMDKFVYAMLASAPGLAAEIISLAANDAEHADNYRKLPLPISVQALAEVVRLTLEEVGGLNPLMESLAAVLQNVVPPQMLAALGAAMKSFLSIGESGKT